MEQKDMYNPETNTLDIRSNGIYPSNVLSNMCSNGFRLDGMICGSMEGFLQSLKRKELDKQRQICSMKGGNARKMSVTSWQTDQIVWWKGRAIDRQGEEFQQLIRRAYQTMFEQNERFRTALMQTRGIYLTHSSGEDNPYKTILTPNEFCGILMDLRDNYDKRDKTQELIEKSIRKKLLYLHNSDSSATYDTVKILKEQLLDFDVVLLEIPVNPTEALPLFGRLCMDEVPDIIVGINMGVMYTQLLREYKCICFNPDLKKSGKLPFIGVNEYSKFHNSVANHFEIISQFHHYTEKDRHQFGGKGDCAQLINDETIFIELYKLDDNAVTTILAPLIRNMCQ